MNTTNDEYLKLNSWERLTGAVPYPPDELDHPSDDDGTMPANVEQLADAVVGHRIVSCSKEGGKFTGKFTIRLDNGHTVTLASTDDCCAYTDLENFLLSPEAVDHVITGVTSTDGFQRWHVYADLGDVLNLSVDWSCGNPFYYGYGFDIEVES